MNNVKKALSIVLAIVMVACMMPMSVFAEDGNAAKIGSTEYATLADAIAKVGDGETITVLGNIESEGISVPGGKNFTLDLNGKTVSFKAAGAGSPGTKTAGLQLLKGSNITIKNGNIDIVEGNKDLKWTSDSESKGIAILIQNYCNLTIDGVNINAENIAHNGGSVARYAVSNNNGTTTIKNSEITMAGDDFAFDCYYDNNPTYSAPTVNVEGSTINGRVEAMGNGSTLNLESGTEVNGQVRVGANQKTTPGDKYKGAVVSIENGATVNGVVAVFGGSTVNVNGEVNGYIASNGNAENAGSVINIGEGANIVATGKNIDVAVYVPNGALNVTGGTITGDTAVYFKSTAINISGGELVATGAKKGYDYSGNGANATGDALVIDSCDYPNGIESVSVSGGEFESANNKAVASFTKDGAESVTGFITGGTFKGAEAVEENLLDENCEFVANGDGTYGVETKKVCKIGDTKYETFEAAIAAGGGSSTENAITLLEDITTVYKMNPGEELYVAKNGKKFTTPTVDGAYVVKSSTTNGVTKYYTEEATVEVTKADGTVVYASAFQFTGTYNGSTQKLLKDYSIGSLSLGTSFIKNCAVNVDLNKKTLTLTATKNYGFTVKNNCSLNIDNGTIVCNNTDLFQVIDSNLDLGKDLEITVGDHGAALVYGASALNTAANITVGNDFAICGNGSDTGVNTINVTGGTIKSDSIAVYVPQANGTLNVTGGTIEGATGIYQKSGTVNISDGAVINGTGAKTDYQYYNNGAYSTGDAYVIDSCKYPGGTPVASVTGGTFTSTYASPVASYNYGEAELVENFISGGTFSQELPLEYCAKGFVPTKIDDETYGVKQGTLTNYFIDKGEAQVGGLMGRQENKNDSNNARVIIGLTEAQLEKIDDKLVIVGGDYDKEATVTIDCAYTYFYDGEEKITADSVGYDAFIIIDSRDVGENISGYGYYRIYNESAETEDNFMFDTLYKNPTK